MLDKILLLQSATPLSSAGLALNTGLSSGCESLEGLMSLD